MSVEKPEEGLGIPEIGFDIIAKVVPALVAVGIWFLLSPAQLKALLKSGLDPANDGRVFFIEAVSGAACIYALGSVLNVFGAVGLYVLRVILVRSIPNYSAVVQLKDPLAISPVRAGVADLKPKNRSIGARIGALQLRVRRAWEHINDAEKLHMRGWYAMKIVSIVARRTLAKCAAEAALVANLFVVFAVLIVLAKVGLVETESNWAGVGLFVGAVTCAVGAVLLAVRNFDIQTAFLECSRNELDEMTE
jgi:hypothetical protein